MGLFSQLTIEGWNEQLMEGLKKVVIFNDFAIKGGGGSWGPLRFFFNKKNNCFKTVKNDSRGIGIGNHLVYKKFHAIKTFLNTQNNPQCARVKDIHLNFVRLQHFSWFIYTVACHEIFFASYVFCCLFSCYYCITKLIHV